MKVTDDILNKLIDNELSKKEISELYNLIKHDEIALGKVKAHQMIDSILKKIDIESAPEDTTKKIMERISKSILVTEKKSGFIKFIAVSFSILIILTISLVLSLANQSEVSEESSTYSELVNSVISYFTSLNISVDNNLMLIIGGILAILFFVSSYFMFEEHRSFKQKLENYF